MRNQNYPVPAKRAGQMFRSLPRNPASCHDVRNTDRHHIPGSGRQSSYHTLRGRTGISARMIVPGVFPAVCFFNLPCVWPVMIRTFRRAGRPFLRPAVMGPGDRASRCIRTVHPGGHDSAGQSTFTMAQLCTRALPDCIQV